MPSTLWLSSWWQGGSLTHWRLSPRSALAIWLLATFAVTIKHSAAFVVWPLFVWCFGVRRAVIAMLLTVIVFFASFLPFAAEGAEGILKNVILYRGYPQPYGFQLVLPGAVMTLLMAL